VINSECDQVGGCDAGSPQGKWLQEDLAASSAKCTLAYWHKPLFSSGAKHGNDPVMKPLWDTLYKSRGRCGHSTGTIMTTNASRRRSRMGNSTKDRGIREFVVGSGGKDSQPGVWSYQA